MNRRNIIIAIAALALVGLLAALFSGKPEPVYQGKRLTEWVLDPKSPYYLMPPAREAVQAADTNGIPFYLAWLKYKPGVLKTFQRQVVLRCNRWFGFRWSTVDPMLRGPSGAQLAFEVLGERGAAASPVLVTCVDRGTNYETFMPPLRCLGSIGRPAIPALIELTTNKNAQIREWSMGFLTLQWRDDRVRPHLNLLANHPDHGTRMAATTCLQYISNVDRKR